MHVKFFSAHLSNLWEYFKCIGAELRYMLMCVCEHAYVYWKIPHPHLCIYTHQSLQSSWLTMEKLVSKTKRRDPVHNYERETSVLCALCSMCRIWDTSYAIGCDEGMGWHCITWQCAPLQHSNWANPTLFFIGEWRPGYLMIKGWSAMPRKESQVIIQKIHSEK